ncbi:hypothetical protein SprV_0301273300 [Sparganum proliferum]
MWRKFKKEAVTNRSKIPKAEVIPQKQPRKIQLLVMNPDEMRTTVRALESEPEERYQLTQRLEDLPAADENASMQTRWFQPRDAAHSTVLGGVGRARRQHQIWFDGKYAVVSKLLVENRLHRTYLDRPTDANKAAFYQCRRLAQQKVHEMQDAWMARKVEDIQGYTDRN